MSMNERDKQFNGHGDGEDAERDVKPPAHGDDLKGHCRCNKGWEVALQEQEDGLRAIMERRARIGVGREEKKRRRGRRMEIAHVLSLAHPTPGRHADSRDPK